MAGRGCIRWKNGTVRLVARNGTAVDGGGVIVNLDDFGAGVASTQIQPMIAGRSSLPRTLRPAAAPFLTATPR